MRVSALAREKLTGTGTGPYKPIPYPQPIRDYRLPTVDSSAFIGAYLRLNLNKLIIRRAEADLGAVCELDPALCPRP